MRAAPSYDRRVSEEPYQRRYGLLRRMDVRFNKDVYIADGGEDAPMGLRDQRLFRSIFWVAALFFAVLIALVILE